MQGGELDMAGMSPPPRVLRILCELPRECIDQWWEAVIRPPPDRPTVRPCWTIDKNQILNSEKTWFLNFSGSILNDSDILDKMVLEKIFRDMKCAEFYRLSRKLLEKTRKVGFEIIISMIKIRKIFDRFFSRTADLEGPGIEY